MESLTNQFPNAISTIVSSKVPKEEISKCLNVILLCMDVINSSLENYLTCLRLHYITPEKERGDVPTSMTNSEIVDEVLSQQECTKYKEVVMDCSDAINLMKICYSNTTRASL